MFGTVLLTLLLLAITCFTPGYLIVRNRKYSPLEKLTLAIGFSVFLIYLVSGLTFLFKLGPRANQIFLGIVLLSSIICLKDIAAFVRQKRIRRVLGSFALLWIWCLLLLSVVRNFSGGGWAIDVWEHYQRTLYFLHDSPPDGLFGGVYSLPARPPLMNVVAAFFLSNTGKSFAVYEVVFQFLNLLVFLPLWLLATVFQPGKRFRPIHLVAFLAVSPMFVQNSTWAWTKLFCAFYVLLATYFYLRCRRDCPDSRRILAFALLCVGLLVHYSAGPYALFLGIHYGWTIIRKKLWTEAAQSVVVSALILSSWFGWSISKFGAETTFASNTTVTDSRRMSASENLSKVGRNIVATIVPHPCRVSRQAFDNEYWQPSTLGYVRDYMFLLYQTNLLFQLGFAGLFLFVALTIHLSLRKPRIRSQTLFWLAYVLFAIVVGIAVHGTEEPYGVAHICLLPISLMGVTVAAVFYRSTSRTVRSMALSFVVADLFLGILIHFTVQSRELLVEHVANSSPMLSAPALAAPQANRPVLHKQSLSIAATSNALGKMKLQFEYLGDRFLASRSAVFITVLLLVGSILAIAVSFIRRFGIPKREGLLLMGMPSFVAILFLLWMVVEVRRAAPIRFADANSFAEGVKTLEVDSESAQGNFLVGLAAYEANDWSLARSHLLHAFLLDFDDPLKRYVVTLLWRINRDHDPTIALIEAVRHKPEDWRKRTELVEVLLLAGHTRHAQMQKTLAKSLTPDADIDRLLATLLLQHHRKDLALQPILAALDKSPDPEKLRADLKAIMISTGESRESTESFFLTLPRNLLK